MLTDKLKSILGLCSCKNCFRFATKYIPIFCINIPVCKKHYKELYISDEDIFED